jgi:hypothetical protein
MEATEDDLKMLAFFVHDKGKFTRQTRGITYYLRIASFDMHEIEEVIKLCDLLQIAHSGLKEQKQKSITFYVYVTLRDFKKYTYLVKQFGEYLPRGKNNRAQKD